MKIGEFELEIDICTAYTKLLKFLNSPNSILQKFVLASCWTKICFSLVLLYRYIFVAGLRIKVGNLDVVNALLATMGYHLWQHGPILVANQQLGMVASMAVNPSMKATRKHVTVTLNANVSPGNQLAPILRKGSLL